MLLFTIVELQILFYVQFLQLLQMKQVVKEVWKLGHA